MDVPEVIAGVMGGSEEGGSLTLYSYDPLGRMSGMKKSDLHETYSYSAQSLRTAKITNGSRTDFIWDGTTLLKETSVDKNINNTYIRGKRLISLGQEIYVHNGRGDVVQMVKSDGTITRDYRYDAFGNGSDSDDDDTNPFRYNGEYYDAATGQYYLRARNYSPGNGRFTQEDPIRSGGNWYAYCGNDPVRYSDSNGNYREDIMYQDGDAELSEYAQALINEIITEIKKHENPDDAKFPSEAKEEQEKYLKRYYDQIQTIRAQESFMASIMNDTPLYYQGGTNLCWAFSWVMVHQTGMRDKYSQSRAEDAAANLSIEMYGSPNVPGNVPSNVIKDRTPEKLFYYLQYGPLYISHRVNAGNGEMFSHCVVLYGMEWDPKINDYILYINDPNASYGSGPKTVTWTEINAQNLEYHNWNLISISVPTDYVDYKCPKGCQCWRHYAEYTLTQDELDAL